RGTATRVAPPPCRGRVGWYRWPADRDLRRRQSRRMESDRPDGLAIIRPGRRSTGALQSRRPASLRPDPMIDVINGGRWTTIQDRGRPGLERFGIPPGGAADWFAARVANELVGNRPHAALIQW